MKKIIKFAFVAAVAAVAGYNVYKSQSVMNEMSDFALANVEALASGGEMQIECDGAVLITCEKFCSNCKGKWTAIGGRGYAIKLIGTCQCGVNY